MTDDASHLHVESEFAGMAAMCEVAEARVAEMEAQAVERERMVTLLRGSGVVLVRKVKEIETRVKGLEDALLEVDRVIDDATTYPGDINRLAEKVRLMIAAALETAGRGPPSPRDTSRDRWKDPVKGTPQMGWIPSEDGPSVLHADEHTEGKP